MGKALTTLADLAPDPRNARRHNPRNVGMIERALNEVGAARSIVVDENNVVLAGNATIEAAAQAGIERVQVIDADGETIIAVRRSGLTDEQKARLALYDNRTAELAEWDASVLAELAHEMDVSALFNDDELAALLAETTIEPGAGGDEFDPTPEEGPTRAQSGDLWVIGGKHRLIVGDCTDPAVVGRVMDGERAQGIFTSPPYAEQRKEHYSGVPADEYVDWWQGIQEQTQDVLADDGSFFVNIKEHSEGIARSPYVHELVAAMVRAWGWVYIDEFCWERTGIPGDPVKMGKFKNQWEPVYWFARKVRPKFYPQRVRYDSDDAFLDDNYRPTAGKLQGSGEAVVGNGRLMGRGKAYPGNRVRASDSEALGHPAAFPLSLPTFFIDVYSDKDDLWLDPFGGSGTTLIAAHRQNRRAYLVEIEPRYADVILRRCEAEGLTCERVDGIDS